MHSHYMTMTYLAFLLLVFVTFIHQSFSKDFGGVCDDALHPSTKLCKRWQRGGMCGAKRVRDFCQRSCNACHDDEGYNRNYKREYLENIEKLVLGEEKKKMSRPKPMKRNPFKVPKTRGWNFMDLLRRYADQSNSYWTYRLGDWFEWFHNNFMEISILTYIFAHAHGSQFGSNSRVVRPNSDAVPMKYNERLVSKSIWNCWFGLSIQYTGAS